MNSPQALTLSAFYQAQLQRLLAHQQAIEAELAKRNLQDLPLEKLLRLSDLISRQLQRLLKAAAPSSDVEVRFQRAGQGGILPPVPAESASTQIKGNQSKSKQFKAEKASTQPVGTGSTPSPSSSAISGVEVAIQAAGQGGFQPPVPTELPSTPIKAVQTSDEITTADAPSPEFKVQSSTFEVQGSPAQPDLAPSHPASNPIKPDQASLVEVRFQRAGQGGILPPVPAQLPSTPIKAVQASGELTATDAPSSQFKVQSSTFEVQGSPLSTLNPQLSTILEHCLMCGSPLPPLLPNGQRPDHYCKCGSPIHGAPGTSLLERCPHCGELQRAHGYNAIRQDNRCCKCGRDLPPLDPKSRTPWLPPARPQAPALK